MTKHKKDTSRNHRTQQQLTQLNQSECHNHLTTVHVLTEFSEIKKIKAVDRQKITKP